MSLELCYLSATEALRRFCASNNVPVGLQLIGSPYEDAVVFQAAKAYEGRFNSAESPFISINNYPIF